jgi:hypothetical protein
MIALKMGASNLELPQKKICEFWSAISRTFEFLGNEDKMDI